MPAPLTDPRWAALRTRDPDATFFYSVRTTGVYCRPSCAARPARPENVAFHATTAAAERAGFRPCKRCRPTEPPAAARDAAVIARLCRLLESRDPPPPLAELADHAGLSPHHLHRLFKRVTGVTPRAYAAAHRDARTRDALRARPTVTDAIYEAGYASSSRFYAAAHRLGMTPTQYRRGGAALRLHYAIGACSLGAILVAATERGVCAILFGARADLPRDLARRFPRAVVEPADARFDATVARVIALVERPDQPAELPLDIRGTAFQIRVWRALTAIAPGTRATYADVARAIGAPGAVRAVARACAANTLAVAIPCHRVVRTDGALAGYRWGLRRKRALLARESR